MVGEGIPPSDGQPASKWGAGHLGAAFVPRPCRDQAAPSQIVAVSALEQ